MLDLYKPSALKRSNFAASSISAVGAWLGHEMPEKYSIKLSDSIEFFANVPIIATEDKNSHIVKRVAKRDIETRMKC